MNDTLEAWLKDNAPEAWFAGYDVADSALIALKDYSESIVYLRAQVATLTERLARCTCTDDYLEITPDCTRIDAMVAESLANDSP